jgi:hypothetical protein
MVKSIIAVAASAAVVAIAIVAVIPPPSSAVASVAVDLPSPAVATVAAATIPAPGAATDEGGCTEAWPYYQQSCLRTAGKSRVVRVIADDRSAATSTGEVERMRQQIKEALEPIRGGEVHASAMTKTARSKATHVGPKWHEVPAKPSGSATTPPNTSAGFADGFAHLLAGRPYQWR